MEYKIYGRFQENIACLENQNKCFLVGKASKVKRNRKNFRHEDGILNYKPNVNNALIRMRLVIKTVIKIKPQWILKLTQMVRYGPFPLLHNMNDLIISHWDVILKYKSG